MPPDGPEMQVIRPTLSPPNQRQFRRAVCEVRSLNEGGTGPVMSPSEYYDWRFFSGICPGIPTRPANHAALCRELSAPGVHLVVLGELLRDNDGAADTAYAGYQWIAGAAGRVA